MSQFGKPHQANAFFGNHSLWQSLIAIVLVIGVMAGKPALAIEAWTKWETALTSSKTYTNPYADVTVAVTYTSPTNKTYNTYGFWDGGSTFKLRFMFPPEIGNWSWRTTSSDTTNTGLHGKNGTVPVTPYISGGNHLYQNGYLKVSADKRYLTYNNGTPFLWKGDTAWMAPIKSTHTEWQNYIVKRAGQHFNVIQVAIPSAFSTLPATGVFEGSESSLKWTPAFWQGLEQKIQYANERGLVVFLTGVGSVLHGFPSTDQNHARTFARNLAARMMGNFVVYSPSADEPWKAQADTVSNQLQASTPIHLITAHPEMTPASAVSTYYAKSYTDFAGVQTSAGWLYQPHHDSPDQWGTPVGPHFAGHLASRYAIEAPLALYNSSSSLPRKPVINLEIMYDLKALHDPSAPYYSLLQQPYPARIVRSTAYLSMLSGAKGITYGCQGVWNWGVQGTNIWGTGWDLTTGMNQPSATHMQYLFDLFSGVQWWALEPEHQLIQNQSSDQLKRMVLSKTPDSSLAMAYLPDAANTNIAIQMGGVFPTPMAAQWFNPLTNARQSAVGSPIANVGVQTIGKPSGWTDAVLILTESTVNTVSAPTFTPNGSSFTTSVSVVLSSATSTPTIRYTTDGSDPTTSSTLYSSPILLTATTTVKAKAWKTGMTESGVSSATFTKTTTPPPPTGGNLVLNPGFESGSSSWTLGGVTQIAAGGANGSANAIKITANSGSSSASQTVNGVTAGVSYTFEMWKRSQAIVVTGTYFPQASLQWRNSSNANLGSPIYLYGDQGTTSWSKSSKSGLVAPADAASAHITLYTWSGLTSGDAFFDDIQLTTESTVNTVSAPTFTPNGSSFTTSVSVVLSSATSTPTIRYTTDGSDPTTSSTLYSSPILLTATTTVKAKAWKTGMTESGVSSATFTKTTTPPPPTGGNLVLNPGFENGSSSWSLLSGVQIVSGGANGSANAVKVTANGLSVHNASQTVSGIVAGVDYTFEMWTRSQAVSGSMAPQAGLVWYNASGSALGSAIYIYGNLGTTSWSRNSKSGLVAPPGAVKAWITVYTWTAQTSGEAFFDDIQLRP